MNILVIKDDKPGHYSQTDGLVFSLKELYPNTNVEHCEVQIKNKLTRKLLRFLLNNFQDFFKNRSNLKFVNYFYNKFNFPNTKPDIIVSTGGNTANINAWFSYAYHCKNILNGALRGLNEEHFTNITTVLDLGYKNQIVLDVAPNTITKDLIEKKAQEFAIENNFDKEQKYYSLLIGGDGSGYKYDEQFYLELIEFIIQKSKEDNIKWLISTSRRTPVEIERLLNDSISDDIYEYFVAYNQKEEKILLPFLGLGEVIFVTEESASMISESVSAGKPTYTIHPTKFKQDKNYQALLNKFEKHARLIRINTNENIVFKNSNFSVIGEDNYINLSQKLKVIDG